MDNNSEIDHPEKHFKSMKCGIPDVFKAQIHLLNILSGRFSFLEMLLPVTLQFTVSPRNRFVFSH